MSMHDIFDCGQKEKNMEKAKSKKNQNAFTWLQACFLGYVGVIWCNSLDNSHFQINVIDDVENLFDYYLQFTFSVLCTLTSCTHYTQIDAKYCIQDSVCCLIWLSLIAYELICKRKFLFWLGILKKKEIFMF